MYPPTSSPRNSGKRKFALESSRTSRSCASPSTLLLRNFRNTTNSITPYSAESPKPCRAFSIQDECTPVCLENTVRYTKKWCQPYSHTLWGVSLLMLRRQLRTQVVYSRANAVLLQSCAERQSRAHLRTHSFQLVLLEGADAAGAGRSHSHAGESGSASSGCRGCCQSQFGLRNRSQHVRNAASSPPRKQRKDPNCCPATSTRNYRRTACSQCKAMGRKGSVSSPLR